MDLTRMDRSDLARLRGVVATLSSAADMMADAGLEPEISITPEATVLRAAPVVDFGKPAPAPVLVEELGPVEIEQTPKVTHEPAPGPSRDETPGPISGPLTDAERHAILMAHRSGASNAQIANDLNRSVQTIGLFLSAHDLAERRRAEAESADSFRPVGEVAAAVVAEVIQARQAGQPADTAKDAPDRLTDAEKSEGPDAEGRPDPVPSAVTAEDSAPTGAVLAGTAPAETPQLPKLMVAVAAPEGPASQPRPVREKPAVPEGIKGDALRIWQHLDRVGYRGLFDADIDLKMCELLLGGTKAPAVATTLGVDTDAIAKRFALLAQPIRDERGRCSIDGQNHLLAVLKARAIRARRAVA